MHLQQLFYLIEINKTRSISQAAENLFITQPTLSIAISNLEKELGCTLLVRTKSGVYPTAIGERAIHLASEITEKVNELSSLNSTMKNNEHLNIFTIPSLNCGLLQEALVLFHKQHPNTHTNIIEEKPSIALPCYVKEFSCLEHPHFFAVISVTPSQLRIIQEQPPNEFCIEFLANDEMVCVANADSAITANNSITIEQFLEYPLIKHQFMPHYSNPFYKKAAISETYDALFKEGNTCFNVSTVESLKQLIAQNVGISSMPKAILYNDERFLSGQIKSIPFTNQKVPLKYYVIYPKHYTLSAIEQDLISILKTVFANLTDH